MTILGCRYRNHRFISLFQDYKAFDDMCSNTTKDTSFEFGIFKDTIESQLVETSHLARNSYIVFDGYTKYQVC